MILIIMIRSIIVIITVIIKIDLWSLTRPLKIK